MEDTPESNTSKLMEELQRRTNLCRMYRDSYFEVIDLFGPTIYTLVTSRHRQRDMQLVAEAENAIDIHLAGGTPEPNVELKTLLELQTVLCTEYRNSYLGIIALVGAVVLKFTGDPHHQLDGVLEGEAARVDDMVERIKHAAD